MAGASITSLSAVLKEFYLGPINEELNQEINVFKLFDSLSVEWAGKVAIIPLHVSRNPAVAAVAEGSPLPTAGHEGYERLQVTAKFVYGRFQMTGPAIASAAKAIGSFGTITQLEMDKLVQDVKVYCNKLMFVGGPSIGLCWHDGSTAQPDYSGRYGVEVPVGPGQTVNIYNASDATTLATGVTVLAVTEKDITFAAPVTFVKGETYVVSHNASKFAVEPTGMIGNLGAPTLFGIDRSNPDNAILRSNFKLAGGTTASGAYDDLALDDLQTIIDKILLASGDEPNIIWMNPVQRQSYTALLQGTSVGNLFTTTRGKPGEGDAGFTALGYNNIPIKTSQNCPKGSIFFMAQKTWKRCELKPGGFAEEDGKILNKVPNLDAYEGFWNLYYETVCLRPNANGILTAVKFSA